MRFALTFLAGMAMALLPLIFMAEKRGSKYVIEIGSSSRQEWLGVWVGTALMLAVLSAVWFFRH